MYGDNYLPPDDSPFDWNGWGPVRTREAQSRDTQDCVPSVVGWRDGVQSILETSLADGDQQRE